MLEVAQAHQDDSMNKRNMQSCFPPDGQLRPKRQACPWCQPQPQALLATHPQQHSTQATPACPLPLAITKVIDSCVMFPLPMLTCVVMVQSETLSQAFRHNICNIKQILPPETSTQERTDCRRTCIVSARLKVQHASALHW